MVDMGIRNVLGKKNRKIINIEEEVDNNC